jgi:SulP family sulfate permease
MQAEEKPMHHAMTVLPLAVRQQLWQQLDVQRLVPALVSGAITGLFAITLSFSVATLIFAGPLASQVTVGIGLGLFGSIVLSLCISLTSSYRGMVASAQEVPGAILALIAGGIVRAFPAGTPAAEIMPTVVAAIALGSLASGTVYWLLGRLRLGSLVRLMPYPVIGGFLAATGWILVAGGLEVCASLPANAHGIGAWFTPSALTHWLPGCGAGLLLFLVSRRYHHYLVLPSLLIAVAVLFFLVLLLSDGSVTAATAQGWLLPTPTGDLLHLMSPADWQRVRWPILLTQFPGFLALLMLSVLSVLLNVSGIELATNRTVDLDQELRNTGLAHLVSGVGGGAPGFHLLGMSTLGHTLGADSRVAGMCAALITAVPLLFSASIVALFPKVLLGGLLIFLGLDFLHTWLWQNRRQLPLSDYLILLLLLAVSIACGFLAGVAVGLVAAIALFMARYIRISIVKNELSGAVYQSRVERTFLERQLLRTQGEAIGILQLQGFLFFGSGQQLLNRWRDWIQAPAGPALRYAILDCRLVTGMDSSALVSLKRLAQLAGQQHVRLLLAALAPAVVQALPAQELAPVLQRFDSLDQAVEWCENDLLQTFGGSGSQSAESLVGQLKTYLGSDEMVQRLLPYLTRRELAAGQILIRQGDPAEELLFLEYGQLTVRLEADEGAPVRVRTLRPGAVVGEMGLYSSRPRSAAVVADTAVVVHSLDRAALGRIEQATPALALVLHRLMITLLTERLTDTTTLMRALAL